MLTATAAHPPAGGLTADGRPPLAPWASHPPLTRGRRVPEPPAPPRNEHQRDRDRIVHSAAFRRLVYKTQVFVNHEGDLFRTRLTHSLEVAQLARSAARTLRLNEDLVEAIALAHDLGHTPFGHAGQDALHECMREHGGFEHNLQSLRVVDRLETRYAAFDGLNLTWETREGILKRCPRALAERLCAAEPGGPARRFLDGHAPSLEAQLVNVADEMAYNTHDIDDGLRAGLITVAQLQQAVPLFAGHRAAVQAMHPALAADEARGDPTAAKRLLGETLRRMLAALMDDLVAHTLATLRARGVHADTVPADAQAALRAGAETVAFSAALRAEIVTLKRFLFSGLYRHPQVVHTTGEARTVVAELFQAYLADPAQMPADHAAQPDTPRAVADYIAGMTDRFALREHTRLTGRRPFDVG
jgi:dGTPase